MSLLAIVIGTLLLINNHKTLPPTAKTNTASSPPQATKPSNNEIENYKVAANLPRYIYIPALHMGKTRIIHLGVGKDGQIASPDNIYDTGWYKDSSKPGQAGAMFIYGHLSNWTANGIFHDLKNLKANDQIIIERGDGKKFTYIVKKIKTYPADNVDMTEVLAPNRPGIAGLNLMTCAGKVIKGTNEFTDRLVVFTELQQ